MDYVSLEEAQFIYTLLQEEKAADVLVEIDEDVRDKFLESLSIIKLNIMNSPLRE